MKTGIWFDSSVHPEYVRLFSGQVSRERNCRIEGQSGTVTVSRTEQYRLDSERRVQETEERTHQAKIGRMLHNHLVHEKPKAPHLRLLFAIARPQIMEAYRQYTSQ